MKRPKTQQGNASDANAAQASSAPATTPSRKRKAKTPSLPFTIELLNRGRAPRNRQEDVTFQEDWRAIPGAREAECALCEHRGLIHQNEFHELQPGVDGRRFIVVPGSHEGGAALASAASARLSDFLLVVANDERWATARSHEAVNTLAEAAFLTHRVLQAVLDSFGLANKGPGLSAWEKQQLDHAVKTAEEMVQMLGQSERFKVLLAAHRRGAKEGNRQRGETTKSLIEKFLNECTSSDHAIQVAYVCKRLKSIGRERTSRQVSRIIGDPGLGTGATKTEIR